MRVRRVFIQGATGLSMQSVKMMRSSEQRIFCDRKYGDEIRHQATDPDVLARAVDEDRILVTFDKDFGELAWRSAKQRPYSRTF